MRRRERAGAVVILLPVFLLGVFGIAGLIVAVAVDLVLDVEHPTPVRLAVVREVGWSQAAARARRGRGPAWPTSLERPLVTTRFRPLAQGPWTVAAARPVPQPVIPAAEALPMSARCRWQAPFPTTDRMEAVA